MAWCYILCCARVEFIEISGQYNIDASAYSYDVWAGDRKAECLLKSPRD